MCFPASTTVRITSHSHARFNSDRLECMRLSLRPTPASHSSVCILRQRLPTRLKWPAHILSIAIVAEW